MLTAVDNDLLCRVEGAAPMGGLMRRHWLPVCVSRNETATSGTIDPGSKERRSGADRLPSEKTTWRPCTSLLGDVIGPGGPITWLLTRARREKVNQIDDLRASSLTRQ